MEYKNTTFKISFCQMKALNKNSKDFGEAGSKYSTEAAPPGSGRRSRVMLAKDIVLGPHHQRKNAKQQRVGGA